MPLSFDFQQWQKLPAKMKWVIGVIVADLLVMLAAYWLLDDLMADQQAQVEELGRQVSQVKKQASDYRRQAELYPQLLAHYQQAMDQGLMTGLDRLKLVATIQDLANQQHLVDFRYKVAADDSMVETGKTLRSEMTRVEFESGAVLDLDALAVWDRLLQDAAGHGDVVEATLEHVQDPDRGALLALRQGQPISFVHMKIDLLWTVVQPIATEAP